MHIPDGILGLPALGVTTALSATGLWTALRRLRQGLPRRAVPLMGLAAAFIFAAQMVNFPVAGGTSGHLVGGVLAAVLLGPSAAIVVMTSVLVVQCLLFADGGLLALGANVFNMAIVAVLGGYGVYRAMLRAQSGPRGLLAATAFASWCSIVLAAIACAVELAWSGVAAWGLVFPAMAGVHMVIGLGEAVITTLVVAALMRTRPELVPLASRPAPASGMGLVAAAGLAATIGLLLFGLPFASSSPDGLERVAEVLGFSTRMSSPPLIASPMADYRWPLLGSASTATSVAGVVGTLVAFAVACGLSVALAPRTPAGDARETGA
jgi:cobalt/nickel transport system permease protein